MADNNETWRALIFTVGSRVCAIRVENVAEIMRPLPVEPVADMPEAVCGLSLIRGAPTPVLDMQMLLEGRRADDCRRFVVLKVGARRVAVAVDTVIGMRGVANADMQTLPPLLQTATAAPSSIAAVGAVDRQLLVVLDAARLVPGDLWAKLAPTRA